MSEAVGLYLDPEIYDILHWPGTSAEFRGIMRGAKSFRSSSRILASDTSLTLLEPACGTGRLLRVGVRAGHRMLGFDHSHEMVEFARQKLMPKGTAGGRRHKLFVAGMEDFAKDLGRTRVDVAFCPINTIRHLETDSGLLAHLREIARVLKDGGVYLVGLTVTLYGMEAESEDIWEGARGLIRVKQLVSFIPPAKGRFEQVHSHLIISKGGKAEHRDSSYQLRCYSREQWEQLLERSELRILGIVNAEGWEIDPPELGYGVYVLGRRS